MSFLKASLLEESITGFKVGQKTLLKVEYIEMKKSVYHQYEGGPIWMATVPKEVGGPGQTFTICPQLLSKTQFLGELPPLTMKNEGDFSWLPAESEILRASGKSPIRLEIQQRPVVEGISTFEISMESREDLGFVPGLGCFMETRVVDFFGRERKARIYHDGHSRPWLGLRKGRRYPKVSLMSFDGVRLRIAYGSPEIRVASIYLADPAECYSIEPHTPQGWPPSGNPHWTPSRFYTIELRRVLEREMLRSRYRYPHGRLGSEIAYSIASRELGFANLILNDPSDGGADMMTRDGAAIFENRLVTITGAMSHNTLEQQILFQLSRLKTRLESDLRFYRLARVGYAFLSYVERDELRTMMFEMRRE